MTFLCYSGTVATQCLTFQFDELGYEPATCRLSSWQNGFGVAYASVTGGTEPYTYQWTSLETGMTSNNTTWGGLNTGLYEIYVHDAIGCVLSDTIEIDSVDVISGFQILSPDFDTTGTIAILPFEGAIKLTVPPCTLAQPAYPDSDTNYMWMIDSGVSDWTVGRCWSGFPEFSLNDPGDYVITVVVINSNGCTDTATQTLPAMLPTYSPLVPTVFSDFSTGQVFAKMPEDMSGVFILYDLSGLIVSEIPLDPGMNSFKIQSGISFYRIVQAVSFLEMASGKLIIAE